MTTRRNVHLHSTIPPMTDQTPTPNPSTECPLGPNCPTCTPFFSPAPPASLRGLAWTDGDIKLNGGSLRADTVTASSILGGPITIGRLRVVEPLTVKQAAKALKKAGRAVVEAETAEREARMAATRAAKALENARTAEKKARDELTAAALR